jgi:4-aminobutyrate aminotransferase-like enzyme
MITNQELQRRHADAVPRGIRNTFPIYAAEAKNAEIRDVEGRRYIDFVGGYRGVECRSWTSQGQSRYCGAIGKI